MHRFQTYISQKTRLSEEELSTVLSMATEKKVHRKEFLVHEGEVCRHKIFVVSGLLRTYRTKDDGSEHIMWFSPETWWTTDPDNHDGITPSQYNIEALEDSEVLLWTKKDFAWLCEHIPGINTFSANLIAENLSMTRQRMFSSMSGTAEEKYDEFVRTYPVLLARLPLHMIASYLGVSRKTLTRIRFAQVRR